MTADADDLRDAERIVLPGVGAFGEAIANLRATGLVEAMEEEVLRKGKPFLGVCVGMQLLARESVEHGRHAGLGWIDADGAPDASSAAPTSACRTPAGTRSRSSAAATGRSGACVAARRSTSPLLPRRARRTTRSSPRAANTVARSSPPSPATTSSRCSFIPRSPSRRPGVPRRLPVLGADLRRYGVVESGDPHVDAVGLHVRTRLDDRLVGEVQDRGAGDRVGVAVDDRLDEVGAACRSRRGR